MKRALGMVVLAALAGAASAQQRNAHDEYEASRRLRLAAEACGGVEDAVGAYCVRRCDRGYRAVSEKLLPRRCRSLEPLPPGTRSEGPRKQTGTLPVPPARNARDPRGTPGV